MNRIIISAVCILMYMISGYFIIFDWQVRMYSGLMMCILFSFFTFLQLQKNRTLKLFVFFSLINLTGLYFDYGFLWYFVPLFFITMWIAYTKKSTHTVLIMISFVISACAFLLIHPAVLSSVHRGIDGIVWMRPYLNPFFSLPYFLGSHNQIIPTIGVFFLVGYGAWVFFQKRSSSWEFFIFLAITLSSTLATLLYSFLVSPLFHIRSFQIIGICVILLASTGLSVLYHKQQHLLLFILLFILFINFIYILMNLPLQPGQYLVSFFPWKGIKQELNYQKDHLIYLHPLPESPTPMLLWGLKYTLEGKESLFSPRIPYKVIENASIIPTNCSRLNSSIIEIYRCK